MTLVHLLESEEDVTQDEEVCASHDQSVELNFIPFQVFGGGYDR